MSRERFEIIVTPEPSKPGDVPVEVRLRGWLKTGLRHFRLRASWAPASSDAPKRRKRRINDISQ